MKILLPIDGSEGAMAALQHAVGIIQGGLAASVVLANVQERTTLYELVTARSSEVIEEVSAAAAAHSLAPAQELLRAAGIAFEVELAHGDPAKKLVEIAERTACDAVVIGARGMDIYESGSLGSVAEAVMHHVRVPVTVVKRYAA